MAESPAYAVAPLGSDIPAVEWQQTPPTVQALIQSLWQRVETLEARLRQDSYRGLHRTPGSGAPCWGRVPVAPAPVKPASGVPHEYEAIGISNT